MDDQAFQRLSWLLFDMYHFHMKCLVCCIHLNKHTVCITFSNTVKPVFRSHSKIDKTKILMTDGSLMKVESISECLTCIKR